MRIHLPCNFKRVIGFALIFLISGHQITAQNNRGCGTGTLPAQFESWVQSITPKKGKGNTNNLLSVFNIPVIVHIIHNNEAVNSSTSTTGNNLSSQQIADQINILNKDFNGLNADTNLIPSVFKSVKGNFQFNFCLAVVNPTGGVLAEPGIERINRNAKGWGTFPYSQSYMNTTVKPNSIWDPNMYLNMWVCPLSGGILGFATFPNPGTSGLSGLSAPYGSTTTDGLVMLNTAFGSIGTAQSGVYNKGRTATHELGHWVGLRHIWGDGNCANDFCGDTPSAQAANFGCPTHPHNSGGCSGNTTGEMTMNYMDYTNDACMYMFTNDQKNRAQLIMTNSPMRTSLLTSTVCNLPNVTDDIGVLYVMAPTYSQVVNCNNFITPQIKLHNFGSNTITTSSYTFNVDGINTQTASWTGTLLPGTSATVTLPQISNINNGIHVFNIGFYLPNGSADPNMQNNTNNQYFSIVNSFTMNATHSGTICPAKTATLTVNGGAAGYTWQPGGLTGSLVTVNPTVTTIYTLTGKTGTCANTRTLSLIVGVTSSFTLPGISVCAGTQTQVSPSGSSCTYTFFPSNLASPFTASSTTAYTVTGSCSNLCPIVKTGTVNVIPQPSVTAVVSPSGSLCSGGTATVTASGGTGYSWSNGSTSNLIIVSPTANTIYTVTGTSGGCSKTTTAMVSVGSNSLIVSVVPSHSVACFGKPLVLQATGGSSYSWNTGAVTSAITLTPTSNVSFTVVGINGACTASAVVAMNIVSNPVVNVVSSSNSICAGGTVSLSASGASSYLWSNGMNTPVVILTPTLSSIQTVTGTTNGCSTTQTISVNVTGSGLGLSIGASTTQICAAGAVTLTGTGVSNYTWMNGSNNVSIIVNPTVTTTYVLTGESGGCSGNAAITITVVPSTVVPLTVLPSNSLCAGQSATLVAGGGFSTYVWSYSAANSPSIVVQVAGSFSVTGSNGSGGCVGTNYVTIHLVPSPLTSITNSNTMCKEPCSGSLNAASTGGLPPYSYSLNAGNCASLPCTNLCEGLYTLKTVDSQGCSSTNYFSIECTPSGLMEMKQDDLLVFPNPARESFTIRYSAEFSFCLYNEIGQQMINGESNPGNKEVRTDRLSQGIYLLHIISGSGHSIQKIVIE